MQKHLILAAAAEFWAQLDRGAGLSLAKVNYFVSKRGIGSHSCTLCRICRNPMEALDWPPCQAYEDDSGRSAYLVACGSNYCMLQVHSINHIHKKLSMSVDGLWYEESYFHTSQSILLTFYWISDGCVKRTEHCTENIV